MSTGHCAPEDPLAEDAVPPELGRQDSGFSLQPHTPMPSQDTER